MTDAPPDLSILDRNADDRTYMAEGIACLQNGLELGDPLDIERYRVLRSRAPR